MSSVETIRALAYPTNALDRGLRLIQLVRDEGGTRVVDAARELGVAPSSAHRLLQALVYREFLIQDDDRTYIPGPAMSASAADVSWSRSLRRVATPYLQELARRVGSSTNLMVRAGRDVRILLSVSVPGSTCDRRGSVMPAHKTAGGKAMLAVLPDVELRRLYLGRDVDSGVSEPEFHRLVTNVDRVRRTNWAIANGELEPTVTAVGTVIRHPSGTALGAVTISTLGQSTMSGSQLDRIIRHLQHSRLLIEADIGASIPSSAIPHGNYTRHDKLGHMGAAQQGAAGGASSAPAHRPAHRLGASGPNPLDEFDSTRTSSARAG